MATRAERGKCVLPKDNPNVQAIPLLLSRGIASPDLIMGLIQQVAYDAWQIAHDEFCTWDMCSHTNPMEES